MEAYEHLWLSHLQARALLLLDRLPDPEAVAEHERLLDGFRRGDLDALVSAIRADAMSDRALCREALQRAAGWL